MNQTFLQGQFSSPQSFERDYRVILTKCSKYRRANTMKMKHKIILTVFLWSMLVSLCMLPLDHIDFNFVNKNVVTLMICIYVCISLIAFLTAWLIGGCIDHLLKNISENKKQNNHIRSVTVIFGEGHQYAEIKSEVCNENHSKWKCLYCR